MSIRRSSDPTTSPHPPSTRPRSGETAATSATLTPPWLVPVAVAMSAILAIGAVVLVTTSSGDDETGGARIATPVSEHASSGNVEDVAAPATLEAPPSDDVAAASGEATPTDVVDAEPLGTASAPTETSSTDTAPVDDEDTEDDDFGDDGTPAIEQVGPATIGPVVSDGTWSVVDLVAPGDTASPSPCDVAGPDAGLLASPSESNLPSTSHEVEVALTWCGSSATTVGVSVGAGTAWTAKEVLSIDPESTVWTSLVVNRDAFPIGAFSTTSTFVAAAGPSAEVTIHSMSFGPLTAGAASGTFTAGAAAPGCSDSCITSAQLVPHPVGTTVGLAVTTAVPATFEAYVFPNAPFFIDGVPAVVGATPVASSTEAATAWSGQLTGLPDDATVHLVLGATDAEGRTQWVGHSFGTMPVANDLAGNDPDPGCAAGCIVEAKLTATDDHDRVGLHVETHTPAKITARVGTSLSWDGDEPILYGAAATESTFHQYETDWDAMFEGLAGDTTYHIVVRATDADGSTDVQVGQFHTDEAPPVVVLVRFEKVLIRHDGDSSSINRGELRFVWGVDDLRLGTRGESKHHTGEQVALETDHDGWEIAFDGDDASRLFTLAGGERDPQVGNPLCQAEPDDPARWRRQDRHDCSTNVKWNAVGMFMTVPEIAELPYCSEYNIGGAAGNRRCHDIDTANYGDDVPRFTPIISFEVLG